MSCDEGEVEVTDDGKIRRNGDEEANFEKDLTFDD